LVVVVERETEKILNGGNEKNRAKTVGGCENGWSPIWRQ